MKWTSKLSSLVPPTKLVPLSDLNCCTGPRIATNLRRALINDELLSSSMSSTWTARDTKHVNRMAQRLWFLCIPRVFLKTIGQGPKTSIPTKVNGGPVSNRSLGRSAILVHPKLPLSFLHTTQLLITLMINRFPPITQYPAARTALSVKWRP